MRLILLGAPGSGKGTQGQRLAAMFNVPCISTGDTLRAAVKAGSELGRKAQAMMNAGELVADDIVVGIVEARLQQPDLQNGFILDGFPRTLAQARILDELLQRQTMSPIDHVVTLDVDDEEIVRRLLLRGQEQDRADDREEVIRCRIRVYNAKTRPLIDYYAAQNKLVRIAGIGSVDEIFRRILKATKASV